jgi:hypothetical protein
MADDEFQEMSEQVATSILKAIHEGVSAERPSLDKLGDLSTAVARLRGYSNYAKNVPIDSYSKSWWWPWAATEMARAEARPGGTPSPVVTDHPKAVNQ